MTYDECIKDDFTNIIVFDGFHNITIQVDGMLAFPAPHVNIYNAGTGAWDATKVATLSILTNEIFYREEDWIKPWKLSKREIRIIRRILWLGHPAGCRYNYWQMCCRAWNDRYADDELGLSDEYLYCRKSDEKYKNHPRYIPSTQPIPHWHY